MQMKETTTVIKERGFFLEREVRGEVKGCWWTQEEILRYYFKFFG